MKTLLFSLLLIYSANSFAQGKLCIKKLPDNYKTSHVRQPVKDFFYLQINKNDKIKLGKEKTICVDLPIKKKHLVKIYEGKTLKESFWFTFDKSAKEKYLQYNEFYGTWMLRD